MTVSTSVRRGLCLAALAAAAVAASAPAAGAQTTGSADCKDPITGQTIANGKMAYHWQYTVGSRGKGWAVVVFLCRNGKITVETVDDPDPLYRMSAARKGPVILPGVGGVKPRAK